MRRSERRKDIIEYLKQHYHVSRVIDLTSYEKKGMYLEGTGSLVFDQKMKIVYANKSERTHPTLARKVAKELGYTTVLFEATDERGKAIYHTNVLMNISDNLSLVCSSALNKGGGRLLRLLTERGAQNMCFSWRELKAFGGNTITLRNKRGAEFLVMSKRAAGSLDLGLIQALCPDLNILSSPIDMIEDIGGGSVRCMIAENFLEPKAIP